MKYFLTLVLVLGYITSDLFAQIQIKGFPANDVQQNIYDDRAVDFYAIKDAENSRPSGQIVFTPGNGNHWEFKWELDGVPQALVYEGDSTLLTIDCAASGVYEFWAEKPGLQPVNKRIIVFYVHVPPYTVSLPAEYINDCQEIRVKVDNFQPVKYINDYPGSHSFDYALGRGTDGGITYREAFVSLPDYPAIPVMISDAVGDRDRKDRWKDAKYKIKIVDRFGLTWESANEAEYISRIPVAGMEKPRLLNTVKIEGHAGTEAGQAPLEVEFRDNSENAQKYEWYLYKDTADLHEPMMIFLDSLMDNRIRIDRDFTYTYLHPGQYKVQLKVFNTDFPNQCWDTTEMNTVNVVISVVNVPNVFTPNGDGINDVFCVQTLSVESFQGVILNRWGRKVYEWNDPEGGWDGRMHGKYASPGTYYYIITAKGLEKSNPPRYVKKGALLLVR